MAVEAGRRDVAARRRRHRLTGPLGRVDVLVADAAMAGLLHE